MDALGVEAVHAPCDPRAPDLFNAIFHGIDDARHDGKGHDARQRANLRRAARCERELPRERPRRGDERHENSHDVMQAIDDCVARSVKK